MRAALIGARVQCDTPTNQTEVRRDVRRCSDVTERRTIVTRRRDDEVRRYGSEADECDEVRTKCEIWGEVETWIR